MPTDNAFSVMNSCNALRSPGVGTAIPPTAIADIQGGGDHCGACGQLAGTEQPSWRPILRSDKPMCAVPPGQPSSVAYRIRSSLLRVNRTSCAVPARGVWNDPPSIGVGSVSQRLDIGRTAGDCGLAAVFRALSIACER